MSEKDELIIQDASSDDIKVITPIYAEAVKNGTASFETEPPSHDDMLARFSKLKEQGFPYLVCKNSDGEVLGYAYAGPYRPRKAYRFSVENSIYVDPRHQGKGVGRLLLDELVALCTDLGFRQMIAVIGDTHNAASVGLHRRAGFHVSGVIHSVGFKHGRWLDTVIMQLALGDGDKAIPS